MMNYEQACSTFDVKDTSRQKSKWSNGQGKAYRLSNALSDQIKSRGLRNLEIACQNVAIRLANETRSEDDEDDKPEIPFLDLFTDLDMRKVLGQ